MNDIIKLAIDAHKGNVEKYSVANSQDVIRQALIEKNNGKEYLDFKDIRDGKCPGLFSVIEEILKETVVDGLKDSPIVNALVDFRNLAEGDENAFVTEDSDLFAVSKAADGTQGIRRQRLGGRTEFVIPTELRVIKIYEELNRVLAGRVDFNAFINKVAQSMDHQILNEVNSLWTNITAAKLGGVTYYPAAGAYSESALLDLIAHVEAAAGGKPATIIGTKRACQKLAASVVADSAKEDLYNMGYYGKFYSTPIVTIPQRHVFGSNTFMYSDREFTIIAGDEKPIKLVYEGNPTILMGDPMQNKDFTQDYMYADKFGLGVVMSNNGNSGIGKYVITN